MMETLSEQTDMMLGNQADALQTRNLANTAGAHTGILGQMSEAFHPQPQPSAAPDNSLVTVPKRTDAADYFWLHKS